MKLKLVVILMAVMMTSSAMANIQFGMVSTNGCTTHLGSPLPTNQTVFIYVSTTDSTVNFNTAVPLTTTYGDDVYLATVGSGNFTGRYVVPSTSYTNNYAGMYVYVVVVETPYVAGTTPTAIPAGTYYGYQTVAYGPLNNTPPTGTDPANQWNNAQQIQTSYQNVPEPTTFALLGLGLGLVALRRRLRS